MPPLPLDPPLGMYYNFNLYRSGLYTHNVINTELSDLEYAQLLGILVKHFQLQCFKDWQLKTIKVVLKGKKAFVNQLTGSGKSLTFQFSPLVTGCLSLVITPTISLMINQAEQLQQRGLRATYLGSCQPDTDVYNKMAAKAFDVIFLTPESLFDMTGAPCHFFKCLAKEQGVSSSSYHSQKMSK